MRLRYEIETSLVYGREFEFNSSRCVFLALKLVQCSTDSFLTLWNNESDKGGLAHSQHGSLQRFSWACEHVFSLSKTLVTLHRTLG